MNHRLQRLLKASRSMTCSEAGDVLGMSKSTVERLVSAGVIGSERICARQDPQASKRRLTTHISRAALLRYIIRTCCGDELDELMIDIEQACPAFLAMAERAKARAAQEARHASHERTQQLLFGQQPTTKARAHTDPFAGHPDLFGGQA
jgi:excisionase family DNA binding protein